MSNQDLGIRIDRYGSPDNPLLVCVHGLMGQVRDFDPFIERWHDHFHVLVPHIVDDQRLSTSYGQENDGKTSLAYDVCADKIGIALKRQFPNKAMRFTGISLGGKICLEVAGRFPEIVHSMCITDVGLGPLSRKTGLFHFIENVIPSLDLQQPWPNLRKQLKQLIPDRMLRILVQNHIEYPERSIPKAQWKLKGQEFPRLIAESGLEDQWHLASAIEVPVHILKATDSSAISLEDETKMRRHPQIHFHEIEGANHFIQINEKVKYEEAVVKMLG